MLWDCLQQSMSEKLLHQLIKQPRNGWKISVSKGGIVASAFVYLVKRLNLVIEANDCRIETKIKGSKKMLYS